MDLPDGWASLLASAIRDAMAHHERLRADGAPPDPADHEEHPMHLSQLLAYVQERRAGSSSSAGTARVAPPAARAQRSGPSASLPFLACSASGPVGASSR